MMKPSLTLTGLGLVLAAALAAARSGRDPRPDAPAAAKDGRDPQVGQSFQVPYRLTDTNHFLVRVRINGKGPFNFLVDSGAPALYVATETAGKIGLKPRQGRVLDARSIGSTSKAGRGCWTSRRGSRTRSSSWA